MALPGKGRCLPAQPQPWELSRVCVWARATKAGNFTDSLCARRDRELSHDLALVPPALGLAWTQPRTYQRWTVHRKQGCPWEHIPRQAVPAAQASSHPDFPSSDPGHCLLASHYQRW